MLEILWSFGAFVVAIGVLVSFHEFGHYWVARRLGVKVLRFSIGFGKVIWRRQARDGVEWAVSSVPLGGYVKMLDEREGPVPPAELDRAFNRQPPWKRIAIVAAGPLSNFLLAIAFYWAVLVMGVMDRKPFLADPPPASAAAQADLHAGDEVLQVGDSAVRNWTDLRLALVDQSLDASVLKLMVKPTSGTAARNVRIPLQQVRRDPEFLFDDLGLVPYEPPIPPVLKEVMPGEPAAIAGFKAGDRLLAHDGEPIESWQDWAHWLRANPGTVAHVKVQRGAAEPELEVIIGREEHGGKTIGHFGAAVEVPQELWNNLRAEYRLDPGPAVIAAVKQTWQMSALVVKLLYRIVVGDVSVKNVSGPIQIAQVAGFSASIGLVYFFSFLASVSVSLGVLNLLPVPVLDGGHLLYYAVEMVKGSPLSERAQAIGQRIGLTLLVALMGLAFYNDIMRLVGQ